MLKRHGAMTIAEGSSDYKTDCSLLLHNDKYQKDFILRTTLDQLSVWKAKHSVGVSPYKGVVGVVNKDVAIIDEEIWVFGIDATIANDVFTAVKIAMKYYNAKADEIIRDIYVKNLNAEQENRMGAQALVNANRKLYENVCKSLVDAARLLGVSGVLNFWVMSSNLNPKIPKNDLHDALKAGNAEHVETDDHTIHKVYAGSNQGMKPGFKFKSNLHLATLKA